MRVFEKFRLLPLLVIFGIVTFVFRAGELAINVNAYAKENASQPHELESPELAQMTPKAGEEDHGKDGQMDENENEGTQDITDTIPAFDDDITYMGVEQELQADLKERRQRLLQRERDMARREALLEAAESQLDRKYNELSALRDEIKELLKDHTEEEEKRILRLVKIYEGMKADDAAKIFNTLSMDVLIDVFSRMSERKMSPILASMATEKARAVTTLLATQNNIPDFLEED